jgi:hypothetical protein
LIAEEPIAVLWMGERADSSQVGPGETLARRASKQDKENHPCIESRRLMYSGPQLSLAYVKSCEVEIM